jgi:hypothetical protein
MKTAVTRLYQHSRYYTGAIPEEDIIIVLGFLT